MYIISTETTCVLNCAHLAFSGDTHLSESRDKVVMGGINIIFSFLNGFWFYSICVTLIVLRNQNRMVARLINLFSLKRQESSRN